MITHRHRFASAAELAPTLLETYFWEWLATGDPSLYLDELVITPLPGPGGEPDNFNGAEWPCE